MRRITWHIPNYHCEHCFAKIKRALSEIDGLEQIEGNHKTGHVTLQGRGPEVLAFAKRRLAEAGYPVQTGSSKTG
jgi:copper chaperone CopZ